MLSFSREYRLTSKLDFQTVFAKPSKVSRQYLLALYRPNDKPRARIGITIAKHHIPRAVDRNKMRRVIRESFRHHQDTLKGLDIVILVRSKCSPINKSALRTDVDSLWALIK